MSRECQQWAIAINLQQFSKRPFWEIEGIVGTYDDQTRAAFIYDNFRQV